MDIFHAFLERGDDDDGANGPSETAKVVMGIVGEELLGHWTWPEDPEELMKEMDRRVCRQEPMYGTGKNRTNGFDPDADSSIFEAARRVLMERYEDDAKVSTIDSKLVEDKEPGIFREKSEFRVEIKVAVVDDDGHRLRWEGPFSTDSRERKADLVPLFADLLDTKVPTTVKNNK